MAAHPRVRPFCGADSAPHPADHAGQFVFNQCIFQVSQACSGACTSVSVATSARKRGRLRSAGSFVRDAMANGLGGVITVATLALIGLLLTLAAHFLQHPGSVPVHQAQAVVMTVPRR